LLYLLLAIVAPFRLIYIPSTLFVSGDCAATASNITANEFLFRLGIVSELFCGTIIIFIVLALYRLFKGVDQRQAVLMVIIGGVLPAAIDFLIVLNDVAALTLIRGADFLLVFEKPQRDRNILQGQSCGHCNLQPVWNHAGSRSGRSQTVRREAAPLFMLKTADDR